MDAVPSLSKTLQVVLSFELARGNTVVRVDQPAGTRCPLAVVLAKPLDIAGFKESHGLPPMVNTWKILIRTIHSRQVTFASKRGMLSPGLCNEP